MRRCLSVAMGLVFCLFSSPVLAAPLQNANDVINSRHVAEADAGTSQDTNGGNGIKTGHITDEAITGAKIAPGAVTDGKITGPISAAKIQQGSGSGLDADTVDGVHATAFAAASHDHDGVYQKRYANVVVVANGGGDYSDPVAAVNSITDASSANPYLVKIMPGVYDIGAQTIQLPAFVDMEGSGENTTSITGNSTVINMGSSELRFLTVESNATAGSTNAINKVGGNATFGGLTIKSLGGPYNTGLYAHDGGVTMRNVTVLVTGNAGTGVAIDSNPPGSLPADLNNVSIRVTGTGAGIYSEGWQQMVFRNGHIDVECGTDVCSGTDGNGLTVRNSVIRGSWLGVRGTFGEIVNSRIEGIAGSVGGGVSGAGFVSFSELVGPVGSGVTCFSVHDENFNAVACP